LLADILKKKKKEPVVLPRSGADEYGRSLPAKSMAKK
jgi:hypothetical protein